MITQKQFWPFFGVFSGFLGVPQSYIFWLYKSVFWQFLCEKNGRKSRDPASRLVHIYVCQYLILISHILTFVNSSYSTNHCNVVLLWQISSYWSVFFLNFVAKNFSSRFLWFRPYWECFLAEYSCLLQKHKLRHCQNVHFWKITIMPKKVKNGCLGVLPVELFI